MDFSFSEKEITFATEAREWLQANVPREWRRDHAWTRAEDPMWVEIAREWQARLADGGWAAISWPKEDGGRGATVIERWLFEEELDRVGAPRPIASSGAVDHRQRHPRHGTEAQRQRFLGPLLSGGDLWCQGFSEPGAGSDLASLRTRADRDGDEFIVNGQKVWTSHADIADFCFLSAVPSPKRRSTRASACYWST
jgi:alkylation response protein AidB-like acyl-CoA dehydrogenase